ncbi:MAG TPA: FecR family protein [Terracidiphilus sp.]|nr:FecR family protein [Terracidiphilus sp.]
MTKRVGSLNTFRNTFRNNLAGNILALAALLAGALCLAPALSADTSQGPGRAIRLSYVDGHVRITQGNQLLAEQANANTPLFEGMQITTVDDGRAEIQFEDGSVARLSPDSSLTLTVLRGEGESGDAEMTLNGGLAYFELEGGNQSGQMSIHFGDTTATASGFTVLRVKMDTPPGEVAVFSGNAHLDGANGALSMDLHGGESVALLAGDESSSAVAESIEPDSWDAWNSDRDQALTAEAGADTGAGENVGGDQSQNPAWSDLDANGNWYNVPGQGYVWSPYDASNPSWDPYGDGSWMFEPGYGYIWTSGYGWGYLPYQCGMWNFYDNFGWGWAPGFGGCQPWWGLGYYGGPWFGTGFLPHWYRPPHRPIPPRQQSPGHPFPVIAVNHRPYTAPVASLPLRGSGGPVTIAGNTVEPLRPLPMRPGYQRPAAAFADREAAVYGNGARTFNSGARQGYVSSRGSYTAPAGTGQYHPAPAPHGYSAPSHGSPAPASHPSGGGGSHGGGGGGGGGGGSHGGGGGGGGAHK